MANLQELSDRAEIEALIYRYAQTVRNMKFDDCGALFMEDATFAQRMNQSSDWFRVFGRAAITAHIANGASIGVYPMIHNILIDLQGDTATSNCLMTAVVATGGGIFGEYHDEMRREDGQWRFAARNYALLRADASGLKFE